MRGNEEKEAGKNGSALWARGMQGTRKRQKARAEQQKQDAEQEAAKVLTEKKKKKGQADPDEEVDDILNEYFGDGDGPQDDESEGEDLYGSDLENDYALDPELDTYEADDADTAMDAGQALDPALRRKIDRQLRRQQLKEQSE